MNWNRSQVMQSVFTDEKRNELARSSRARRKILFVTRTYEYGGAEKHLVELIRRLGGSGLELSILCLGTDFYRERLSSDLAVDVTVCNKIPKSLWDWVQLFRSAQPDAVVLVYGWSWGLPWTASLGAWLAGVRRRFSIQHLVTPVNVNRSRIHRATRRLLGPLNWKISATLLHTTICVSDALRTYLIKELGFPAKKTKTIHNGISLSEFVPFDSNMGEIRGRLRLRPDEFVLVCVARLSKQKGIDILLQAVARALRNGIRCKCVIVGDGPLKDELLEQARTLELSGHVFFEGFHEDIRPYLQAATVFVLTSRGEGLPLSVLEAMACGLPSIVTNVGGNAEAITHQVHGLVVSPESVDAVTNAISYLATHPQERAQMARMSRAKVCEEFDIEQSMAAIGRVILS